MPIRARSFPRRTGWSRVLVDIDFRGISGWELTESELRVQFEGGHYAFFEVEPARVHCVEDQDWGW